MKNIFVLALLFSLAFLNAQQTQEFRRVKEYYDYQRTMIGKEFRKKIDSKETADEKNLLLQDFYLFMSKMDSIQNTAYIGALISVKNREDLSKNSIETIPEIVLKPNQKSEYDKAAEYPGGLELMRQKIGEIFYTGAVREEQDKTLKTEVVFVVERDGTVSDVHATGDNHSFNRQAEIALYLLPEKFSPAIFKGENIRYRFRIPFSMNFE